MKIYARGTSKDNRQICRGEQAGKVMAEAIYIWGSTTVSHGYIFLLLANLNAPFPCHFVLTLNLFSFKELKSDHWVAVRVLAVRLC